MASTIDFRCLDEGLGGKRSKRKRAERDEDDGESMDIQQQPSKRAAIAKEGEDKPVYGRPTYDGVMAGKVSGRKWKEPKKTPAAALKRSGRKTTLEEKNRLKQVKKAYQMRMSELKEQIRSNKQEKRRKADERKRIKKENELKGVPVQRITNPKTLKKMSKKQRKLLRVAPD